MKKSSLTSSRRYVHAVACAILAFHLGSARHHLLSTALVHEIPQRHCYRHPSLQSHSCSSRQLWTHSTPIGPRNPSRSLACNQRRELRNVSLRSHLSLLHPAQALIASGTEKFLCQWRTYSLIPIIAGIVGWFTNYLAVKMIFQPITWFGIPLWRRKHVESPGDPVWNGLGWQGIVPAKTKKMSEAMVNATVTQLIQMEEVVQRLDPQEVADILLPQAPQIVGPMVDDLLLTNNTLLRPIRDLVARTVKAPGPWQENLIRRFLVAVTKDVQRNVNQLLNLRNCVVNQMLADRSLLGKLFQIAGRKELTFLTDSGLWFGFMLGIIQLLVALIWDNPWTLSFGGLIVGLATNWLALKWIFEPVNPTPIVGNLVVQGLFLRRQKEVSADFSKFFATKILTSEQLWQSILTDPSTAPTFARIWAKNLEIVTLTESNGLIDLGSDSFRSLDLFAASEKATGRLFPILKDLHPYVDEALDIEATLRSRMVAMTSQQFERVLHPIFEEDELTLILSGGALGFAAGLVQQGLASGTVSFVPTWRWLANGLAAGGIGFCAYAFYFASRIRPNIFRRRIFKRLRDTSQASFDVIDSKGHGYLEPRDVARIAQILGIKVSAQQLSEAIFELDKNHDGRITLEEFEDWWNQELVSDFHRDLAKELGLYTSSRRQFYKKTRREFGKLVRKIGPPVAN